MSARKEVEQELNRRVAERLSIMPDYVRKYIRSIRNSTSPRTQHEYLSDLKVLLDYVAMGLDHDPPALADLAALDKDFFEQYLEYLSDYERNGNHYVNGRNSLLRKLVSLRRFFAYLYNDDMIPANPVMKVEMPKVPKKQIVRLDNGEAASLLRAAERGEGLTKKQRDYFEKQSCRDVAILSLFLSTGIRVSECAELDVSDVDPGKRQARIVRKGGNEAIVWFSDDAAMALYEWLEQRKIILGEASTEKALFLSSRKTRLGVRGIQKIVAKYAQRAVPMKHVTPHKLRATFATELYRATGDIYLVADSLGHSDVNTTKEHYAELSADRKEAARNAVRYEKKEEEGPRNPDTSKS